MSQSGKSWILSVVKFLVLVAVVIGGVVLFERVLSKRDREELAVASLDPVEFGKAYGSGDQLLVLNYLKLDSPQARQLTAILAKIDAEKTYGDRVICRVLEVNYQRHFAKEQGVDPEDPSGQLDFFVGGKKRGSLKGVTDPKIVHETIQTYLDGLIKRYGKGWVPEVPGMQRAGKDTTRQPPGTQ
jgi:hypothetical protein